jgi:hypothetical protein
MNTNFFIMLCLSLLNLLSSTCFSQDTLKYRNFVERLYDMKYLASIPEEGEYSGNFSSSLWLNITWDSEEQLAVSSPQGMFFGTGSEDYKGYTWSAEPPFPTFDSPFASQPFTPLNGNGHTIVDRFHIADNIPFQESFEAYIEKY